MKFHYGTPNNKLHSLRRGEQPNYHYELKEAPAGAPTITVSSQTSTTESYALARRLRKLYNASLGLTVDEAQRRISALSPDEMVSALRQQESVLLRDVRLSTRYLESLLTLHGDDIPIKWHEIEKLIRRSQGHKMISDQPR